MGDGPTPVPFVDNPTPPDQQGPVPPAPPSYRAQVAAQTAAQSPGAQPAAADLGTSQPLAPSTFAQPPRQVVPGSAPQPESQMRELTPQQAEMRHDSFGAKIYHGILNALGGANDVTYSIDPATGKMVQHVAASGPGTQWKRIISGAFTGYAAGAGLTGPGSTAAKFGRGFQAGQQQVQQRTQQQKTEATEDFKRQQDLATENLRRSMLTQQVTELTFRNSRNEVDASEADAKYAQDFQDIIAAGGAGTHMMGHFDSPEAVREAFANDPTLHDSHVQGRIVSIPHIENGKINGVDAAFVSNDWLNQKYQGDFKFTTTRYQPDPKTGEMKPYEVTFTSPKGSLTNDQVIKATMAQSQQEGERHDKQVQEKHQEAMEDIGERRATAAERTAAAAEARAERGPAGTIAPEDMPATVKAIGEGRVSMQTLSRLIAKNPSLSEEITKAYPDFREGAIKAFDKQQTEFTSGKTGGALNAAGTSAQHLTRLLQLNTAASHIPGTTAYRDYMSQVLPAAEELSKYYGGGKATVSGIEHYQKLLGGIGPGRDGAIYTTMGALADKFSEYQQQWQNSLPSRAWSIPMPTVTPEAQADLKTVEDYLARHDPKYVRRIAPTQPQITRAPGAMGAGSTPQQSQVTPNAPTHVAPPGTPLPPEALPHLKAAAGKPMRMTAPDGTDYGVWQINQAGQPVRVGN